MGFKILLRGIVQGVGFRPFIYNLALKNGLKGYVENSSDGVEIFVEGGIVAHDFLDEILTNLPPLAYVIDYSVEKNVTLDEHIEKFYIKKSRQTAGITFVSPDTAICSDCKEELFDEKHHKYMYPFINCTNCGPRYSIMENIPYDRANTSMKYFKMCSVCQSEYDEPENRRFHAQPNACNVCGPKVYFKDLSGKKLIEIAQKYLNDGKIIGVKGIGGYHIMCDAMSHEAVSMLRDFKSRKFKPFALMVKDKNTLMKYNINLSLEEEKLFESKIAPIIIKEVDDNRFFHINPLGKNIGVMKAYTPLHLLLFDGFKGDFLIATSGNIKDEPIAIDEKTAEERLSVCELFLHNDREIVNRVDDSLVRFVNEKPYMLRRSRGYAPLPVVIRNRLQKEIVGLGAHLKSSICFVKNDYAFISQYIGDLENYEAQNFYEEVYERMKRLFRLNPAVAITDLHPDFFSTKFAKRLKIPTFEVQHHIAHMYANMAENSLTDNVIGIVFDGTGLGDDGKIWGGEVFVVKEGKTKREIHLEYTPLIGGESAIKNPYRMFLSYIVHFGIDNAEIDEKYLKEYELIKKVIKNNVNIVETSSMGRFFEAIGAYLLGIEQNEFEAHSAIALEGLCVDGYDESYEAHILDGEIKVKKIVENIISDFKNGEDIGKITTKFHNTVADLIFRSAIKMKEKYNINRVSLSGGVFQNIFLLRKTVNLFKKNGFEVFLHKNVPSNDGCISLGQVYFYILNNR
ncbi:MAG: hydrogenase maturation protein HypF [Deferribacteres bacterium]|nr:hydrogenase maturation protein HypF [Deferribacteres bacterium]